MSIQWSLVVTIFLGTVPLLGAFVWQDIEIRACRNIIRQERIAFQEEREHHSHPLIR